MYAPSILALIASGMIQLLSPETLHKKWVETSVGKIAYYETSGKKGPIVLVHGNSCSKEYMLRQLDALGNEYHMIAIDLPGHGESDNITNLPEVHYTLTGYAHVVAEVIDKLDLGRVVLLGWSLGGHIAMEMMMWHPDCLKGVLVAGSAPFIPSPEGLSKAYLPTYSTPLSLKKDPFTMDDVKSYISQGIIDFEKYPILAEASMRADGLARFHMVSAVLRGEGVDEKAVVEKSLIPLGIIMGKYEHAINNDYVKSLNYANCMMMETIDAGHDCQWSHPKEFNAAVRKFLDALEKESSKK